MVPQHLISLPKTPMFWLAKVRWSACIRIFFAQHMYTSLFSQFPGVKTFPSYHCWFLQLVSFPHRVDSEYVAAMSPMTSPWRGVTYIFRQHRTLAWQAIGLKSWLSGFGTDHRALGSYIYIQKYECTYKKNLMYGIFKRFSVFEWLT